MATKGRIALAEALGTAVLVFAGPGTAIFLNAQDAGVPAKIVGVALAFGLALMCMAYTIGSISGCHINPAVTIGMWVTGKTKTEDVPVYIGAQLVGGLIGSSILALILSGTKGYFSIAKRAGFASNGWGAQSPGKFGFSSVAIIEVVVTMIFVLIVISTSRKSFPAPMTGVSVGLGLTLVHLISIPVSNTSVNPARSLATAVYAGGNYLSDVWAFFVFPIVGAVIAGLVWRALCPAEDL
jgi:aquaporin Z